MRIINLLAGLILFTIQLPAQSSVHPASSQYVYPKEPDVATKLEHWRDQKFGIIIHWGLYAVPGIVESWTLCNEDWVTRDSNTRYEDYKKWYWGLKESFNPVQFEPAQWAQAAKAAGMRYLVFTTKHHDGFSMFDTRYDDFKITNGPFKNHPKANVAKYVFEAFRSEHFLIGAYYSKPDWHSQYFWWDHYATPDRNVNYDIRKFPRRWNQFVEFTHNQIGELTTGYGNIDILWLDGGWVRPRNTVTQEVLNWGAPIPPFDQAIDMPALAQKVRKNQPGILMVDRTVHGEYENYKTPEQAIPKEKSDEPWESCITLGNAWGYIPNDQFKSKEKLIHTLIEIVAKGGNLLLGVGPDAQGRFLPAQVNRLREMGQWLNHFGEGIYNTRTTDQWKSGNVYFTRAKEKYMYALPLFTKEEPMTKLIKWKGNTPRKGSVMTTAGTQTQLNWKTSGDETTVFLPPSIMDKYKSEPALVIRFERE